MDQKQQQGGKANDLTRRELMRTGAAAAAGLAVGGVQKAYADTDVTKTRSYNPEMKYRPLGKTGLWISSVCLGGHWKRVDKMLPGVFKGKGWLSADLDSAGFRKNRRDLVSRCIERGINYIDACTMQEVMAYSEALRGRRDAMYLGFSWYQEEMRRENYRTTEALLGTLDKGMREAKLEYVDLWRITMHEQSGRHTNAEVDEMMGALEKARKQGKCRMCGFSSHDRPHIKWMIETYPEVVQVVVTPYTAKSKVLPRDSVFEAVTKNGIGFFGIKPFAGTSLFKGDSSPDSPTREEDDRLARMAIRYILCNPAITAPIPGMINPHQVDNVVKAVQEPKLDETEARELGQAMDEAWARLPADYQWLKNWEYV
ncbi:MAG: aldo/keto reductase [Planctomycetota bacterium]|jgi:aryl-alcohol dehydrogenase-like predicted oxidoreductase